MDSSLVMCQTNKISYAPITSITKTHPKYLNRVWEILYILVRHKSIPAAFIASFFAFMGRMFLIREGINDMAFRGFLITSALVRWRSAIRKRRKLILGLGGNFLENSQYYESILSAILLLTKRAAVIVKKNSN